MPAVCGCTCSPILNSPMQRPRTGNFCDVLPAGCCAWFHFSPHASFALCLMRSACHGFICTQSPVVGLARQRRRLAPSWGCQHCRQNRKTAQSRRVHCQSWRASPLSPLRCPGLPLPVCQMPCHMLCHTPRHWLHMSCRTVVVHGTFNVNTKAQQNLNLVLDEPGFSVSVWTEP